jgi:hypothetical protein
MTDTIPSCAEFDYGQYEPEVADELRQVADRIRSRGQDQIAAIVHIGKELNEVKKRSGTGTGAPGSRVSSPCPWPQPTDICGPRYLPTNSSR